jgi:hypothetical protein
MKMLGLSDEIFKAVIIKTPPLATLSPSSEKGKPLLSTSLLCDIQFQQG